MKIMITAGGTVEKIDSVRSILNFSTGCLGNLIAEQFPLSLKSKKPTIYAVKLRHYLNPQKRELDV